MTESTSTLKKTQLTLPAEVAFAFQQIAEGDTETRDEYITRLREAGWTLQSISEVTPGHLTRERVRQIVDEVNSRTGILVLDWKAFPVPTPPQKPVKAPRQYVEPDPEKLDEALRLQLDAQKVRSNSDKFRAQGERYTALLAEMHLEDGVPLYRLSKRLSEQPEVYGKASHGALRFRLARYGYKLPQTGNSKVYTPIKAENRLTSA